jgi:hypothetical protein
VPTHTLDAGEGGLPLVRFHAQPGSKRYAENEDERQTIIFRANVLGDRLLSAGTPCGLSKYVPRKRGAWVRMQENMSKITSIRRCRHGAFMSSQSTGKEAPSTGCFRDRQRRSLTNYLDEPKQRRNLFTM